MGGIYWLASYPKSGNTWLRVFLANLEANQDQPVPVNQIGGQEIASHREWLDDLLGFDTAELTHDETERFRSSVYGWYGRFEEIRYHKIHDALTYNHDGEPLISRPGTLGALYILRNPLDVAPSAAHHWNVDMDHAIQRMGMKEGALAHSSIQLTQQVRQRVLSWSDHVLSWVDAPGLKRETIRYEDMLQKPLATFTRIATFLQLPADPERVAKAIRFSSFQELATQEAEHGFAERPQKMTRFFRQGKSGGWRNILSEAQVARIVADHGQVMRRFGYLNDKDEPVD